MGLKTVPRNGRFVAKAVLVQDIGDKALLPGTLLAKLG